MIFTGSADVTAVSPKIGDGAPVSVVSVMVTVEPPKAGDVE